MIHIEKQSLPILKNLMPPTLSVLMLNILFVPLLFLLLVSSYTFLIYYLLVTAREKISYFRFIFHTTIYVGCGHLIV